MTYAAIKFPIMPLLIRKPQKMLLNLPLFCSFAQVLRYCP